MRQAILIAVLLLSGCAHARWISDLETKAPPTAVNKPLADEAAAASTGAPAVNATSGKGDDANSHAAGDPWQQSLARLHARTDLDPQAKAKLIAEMEQVEPVYRPMMARMLEATLATSAAQPTTDTKHSAPESPTAELRREATPLRPALAVPPTPPPAATITSLPPAATQQFVAAAMATPTPSQNLLAQQPPALAAAPLTGPGVVTTAMPPVTPAVAAAPAVGPPPVNVSSEPDPPAAPSQMLTGNAVAKADVGAAVAKVDASSPAKVDAPADWHKELQDAISALQNEIGKLAEKDPQRQRLEVEMKLLQLAAGDKDAAVKGLERIDPWLRDYWKHQFHALAVSLDDGGTPVASRRAALALRELHEATSQLAIGSTLDVRNLAFCTQVDSFGRFTEFPKSEFQPNQELLLYAEIDNVSVAQTSSGFESSLQGSYQIVDAAGQRLADVTFPAETDVCRNRRRDYFIPFRLYLPKKIAPGRYTLQLTVEDLKGKKFGQGNIDFTVASEVAAAR